MKWNGFAKKFFILLPFWIAGILLILISVQLSELYTAQSKANEYAKSLLNRANEIYYNVNKSLDYLNENTSDKCGEALKIATYDYRFIEDAGRIKGNEIICSAMKMAFYGYKLSNDKLILDESIKIWEKIDGYMNSNFKVKVIAKKQSFIVLSPHAYNAYQIPPKHTTGSIMSLDGKITYYEFSNHSSNKFYLVTESRACSENKYFCANSRVYSNILLNYGSGRLFFYIIIGIFLVVF
ncbi:CSS-motif domain-containing protein [Enterobacter mori]